MASDIIQALGAFSTCDIADALVKLGDLSGGFIPGIELKSPKAQEDTVKIIGPAYPVTFERLSKHLDSKPKITQHFVDTAPSGSVIFVTAPDGMWNALWGGITTLRAQKRGIVGTVINGRVRDLPEIREAGYPVFASGVGTTTPAPVAYISTVNEEISFDREHKKCVICPGDIIIADLCGVLCVPQALVEKTLETVKKIAQIEELIAEEVRNGKSFSEASKHRQTQS